jgi:hypothetical protein
VLIPCQTITYNEHYERTIISERPTLYDEDGYEMDSEDDEDGEALAAANEFYPYNDVRMEGKNNLCRTKSTYFANIVL